MIQMTAQMRILVAVNPVDFRKGIDGLSRVCREKLSEDPFRGTLFVFTNRRRTGVKILAYDGNGFWLCQMRLSQGKLRWWPDGRGSHTRELAAYELTVLLRNGNPSLVQVPPAWKPLSSSSSAEMGR
jgi:transposase